MPASPIKYTIKGTTEKTYRQAASLSTGNCFHLPQFDHPAVRFFWKFPIDNTAIKTKRQASNGDISYVTAGDSEH